MVYLFSIVKHASTEANASVYQYPSRLYKA